ncbi:hypothetical protein P4S95_23755 [Aneurinibacillus aneurinilyticus]|nr:hypothetical protein [Aneurinibacillus aneurinilyticus]
MDREQEGIDTLCPSEQSPGVLSLQKLADSSLSLMNTTKVLKRTTRM